MSLLCVDLLPAGQSIYRLTVVKQQLSPDSFARHEVKKDKSIAGEHGLRINFHSTILLIVVKHSTIAYHYKMGTNIKFDWKPHVRQTLLKRTGHMFGWKPRLR